MKVKNCIEEFIKSNPSKSDVIKFKKFIIKAEKICRKNEIELDSFDIMSKFDSKLTYEENINQLELWFQSMGLIKTIPTKEEIERLEQEAIEHLEQEISREFQEDLKKIERSPNLDKYYSNMFVFIETVRTPNPIASLIITGDVGLGKTEQTLNYLNNYVGWKVDEDYAYLGGHMTPLEFYMYLYDLQKKGMKLLVIDDVETLFENKISYSILLSLLQTNEKRYVYYSSTSEKLKVPRKFKVDFPVIFLCNDTKKYNALISRSFVYDIDKDFDYHIRKKMIKTFCLIKKFPREVWEWINKNTTETSKNLDLRLVQKVNIMYEKLGNQGLEILKDHLIETDDDILFVKRLLAKYKKEERNLAVKDFIKYTGKSRATFYNYMKRIQQKLNKNERFINLSEKIRQNWTTLDSKKQHIEDTKNEKSKNIRKNMQGGI